VSPRLKPSRDRDPLRYLSRLLPASMREVVAGDLEEIRRTRQLSRLRYWWISAASILSCWVSRQSTADQPAPTGDNTMSTFLQDVAYGFRVLRRAPGFTAAAVLTLGIGIGINAATFSIVNILSLKPLAYRHPSRVAFILGTNAARHQRAMNLPLADAIDVGRQMRSFEGVAAYEYWSANLTGGSVPERIQAYKVTAETFALLGVDAATGRALTASDGKPESPSVVLLSDGLWQRRFGGDPSIVGRVVMLDGTAHTVVGVMPRRFEFPVFNFKGEAWTAFKGTPDALARRAGSPSIVAIARLKPEASYQSAQAELDTVMHRL